ncbi:MAG: alkaline phosphatase family protein [Bdellovibrionales bacterium]|nr:alkaline phosphatase family protein [Bdellovibrionales bacterium]
MRIVGIFQILILLLQLSDGFCEDKNPSLKIAFGSCIKPFSKQPFWNQVIAQDPDIFVFLGDNVYADAQSPAHLAASYAALAANAGLKRLKENVEIIATWDDHDYGVNDAGAENPIKQASQKLFLDFFQVAKDDPRWKRPGIYHSKSFGASPQKTQVIVLDTRYFRDPLRRLYPDRQNFYLPSIKPDATILGPNQWRWLEKQFQAPANLRIIVSSIQFLTFLQYHEKWANFPGERARLLRLIETDSAEQVIFLSGDRHHGEISALTLKNERKLFDITSSGLTVGRTILEEENPLRLGALVTEPNFGILEINWLKNQISMALHDSQNGQTRSSIQVKLPRIDSN